MRWLGLVMMMACQTSGVLIDDGQSDTDTDTDTDSDTDTDVEPPEPDFAGAYEGEITAVVEGRMGGARGCAGPLDLSIDSAGGATGLATCDTDWDFAYAGDLLGQVDEDGKTLTGTWVVDLWNYTIPIEFSGTVIDGEADLTFSYEDDWVTISEGVMLGDRISP